MRKSRPVISDPPDRARVRSVDDPATRAFSPAELLPFGQKAMVCHALVQTRRLRLEVAAAAAQRAHSDVPTSPNRYPTASAFEWSSTRTASESTPKNPPRRTSAWNSGSPSRSYTRVPSGMRAASSSSASHGSTTSAARRSARTTALSSAPALAGTDRLFLLTGNEPGFGATQSAVIRAAQKAGVSHCQIMTVWYPDDGPGLPLSLVLAVLMWVACAAVAAWHLRTVQ